MIFTANCSNDPKFEVARYAEKFRRIPCLLCSSSIFVTSAPQRRSGREAAGLQDECRRNAELHSLGQAASSNVGVNETCSLAMEKNLQIGALLLEKSMWTATRRDMKTCWQILFQTLFLHSWFMWKMDASKMIISLRHVLHINPCNPGHNLGPLHKLRKELQCPPHRTLDLATNKSNKSTAGLVSIWMFPKIGVVNPPKWMVYNGKPYFSMDDLGVPLFLETPIYLTVRFLMVTYKQL